LDRTGEWLGITGLLIFSFFSLLSISGANLGFALMLLALIISPAAWRRLVREQLFWICLLTIAYIILSAYLAGLEFPEEHKTIIKKAKAWAWLFLFFIPGWWMSRAQGRVPLSLGLMLAGFSLGILSSLDATTLNLLQNGVRSGLHFGKPIIFGFDSAVAILTLIMLTFYLLSPNSGIAPRFKVLLTGLTFVGILFFIQGLIISQSRGVWLAILFALPVALFLAWKSRHTPRKTAKTSIALLLGGVALISAIMAMNWNTLTKRISYEQGALSIAFNQGLDEAPLGSSTARLHLWRFAIDKWLERPLLGWGPGTTYGQTKAENSVVLKDHRGISFDHLHNAYLEVLFQLGLIGLVLICVTAVLITSTTVRAYRMGNISNYMLAFLLSNFVLILIYSLTDFRHLHWNWRFYWLILGGIIFSLTLIPRHRADAGS
jgi:O-antigen ligase